MAQILSRGRASKFPGAVHADVPARLDREAWAALERLLADGVGAPPGLRGRFDARRAEAVLDPESR
jgi:hypothetical protein